MTSDPIFQPTGGARLASSNQVTMTPAMQTSITIQPTRRAPLSKRSQADSVEPRRKIAAAGKWVICSRAVHVRPPNAQLQPRRLMIAAAADDCKPTLRLEQYQNVLEIFTRLGGHP